MDDRKEFVDTIVESLSDEPANYNQIMAINWGKEPLTSDASDLELVPTTALRTNDASKRSVRNHRP